MVAEVEVPARSVWTFPNTTEDYAGHLSPSQVTDFLSCGMCYYLNRVRKLAKPLSINLPIGSALHKAVEGARIHAMTQTSTFLDADLIATAWFEQETSAPADPESGAEIKEIDLGSKFDSLGKAKDLVAELARFLVPKVLALDKRRGKVAATEFNLLQVPSPWPFAVEGRLDALYVDWLADASKPELAALSSDLKTSGKQERPDEFTAIAQGIYRQFWAARELPLTVIADVVSKTKSPELVSYPLSIDDYGQRLVYQTVMDVAEDISAGRFRPRPNWRCDYVHGFPEFQVAVNGFAESD